MTAHYNHNVEMDLSNHGAATGANTTRGLCSLCSRKLFGGVTRNSKNLPKSQGFITSSRCNSISIWTLYNKQHRIENDMFKYMQPQQSSTTKIVSICSTNMKSINNRAVREIDKAI